MIILRPENAIFERFWPFSKFHLSACSTLSVLLKISAPFPDFSPVQFYRCNCTGSSSGLTVDLTGDLDEANFEREEKQTVNVIEVSKNVKENVKEINYFTDVTLEASLQADQVNRTRHDTTGEVSDQTVRDGKVLNLQNENRNSNLERLDKTMGRVRHLKLLATKNEAKLIRLEERRSKWLKEVSEWRSFHLCHPDYHVDHPEEETFRAVSSRLDQRMDSLKGNRAKYIQQIATLSKEHTNLLLSFC